MISEYQRQLKHGKKVVTDYIGSLPGSARKIAAIRWLPQDAEAFAKGIQRLELFLDKERKVLSFHEDHLADSYGSEEGEGLLRKEINNFFNSLD